MERIAKGMIKSERILKSSDYGAHENQAVLQEVLGQSPEMISE